MQKAVSMKMHAFARLRRAAAALAAGLLLAAVLCPAAAAADKAETTLRVLGDSNNYPFEWYDKQTKTLRGIDVDILSMISERSGVQFEYVYKADLGTAWEAMKNGGADVIAGVYVDDALAREYHLTPSAQYTTEDSMAVIRQDGSFDAAASLTVAVNASFIGMQEYLRTLHPAWTQVTAASFDGCLQLVSEGEADLTFLDIVTLQKSSPLFDYQNLTLLPELTVSLPICLGLSSELSPETAARINAAIASLDPAEVQAAVLRSTAADNTSFSVRNFVRYHPAAAALVLAVFLLLLFAAAFFLYRSRMKDRNERQLAEKNRQLERANRAKSEFLSLMSHDMRTPLNGILGMAHIAAAQGNPPETDACLAKIDTSSRFLLGLISDALNMAKTDSGEIILNPEPYAVPEFNSYIDAVIRPLCDEKGLKLVLEVRPADGYVPLIDKLRANQILFSLLTNAVKFTPEGGTVTVRLTEDLTPAGRIALEGEISDTGVGMSEEFQKRMFEPFLQEERSGGPDIRGSGLGLAIVKRLTDQMGGTIRVRSRPGEGTSVMLSGEFDCVPAEKTPSAARAASGADRLEGRRVLLCEDHPLNQEIAAAILKERGVTAEIAEDGQRGLEMFARSPAGYYDAVLMDLRMPVMDGWEAARAIRALKRPDAAAVPIVAMSADAFEEDVQKCRDAGMNGHVPKPIDPDALFRALSACLKG